MMFSSDNGNTWSEPIETNSILNGDRHTAKRLSNGKLIITYRCQLKDHSFFGDWVCWIGSYEDIQNRNDGDFFIRLKKTYETGDCAYPGLEVLDEDTCAITTYGHWEKGQKPYIISARLSLRDLPEEQSI